MSKRKRFCSIEACMNFDGTNSLDFQFYRIPLKGLVREAWIANITKHQKFNDVLTYIQVCNLHFTSDNFDKDKRLIKGAIPTLFGAQPSEETILESSTVEDVTINNGTDFDHDPGVFELDLQVITTTDEFTLESSNEIESVNVVPVGDENPATNDFSLEASNAIELIEIITVEEELSPIASILPKLTDEHLCDERITHQEKIFKLEHSLYRANDIIRDLKAKLELKNKTIARLNASVHYYKKEKAKRDRESEEKAGELIDDAAQILHCMKYGKRSLQYNQAVRKFALTAHFHSPSCYNFIRKKFNLNLPNVSTIRKWYAKCSAQGEPGIGKEGLVALKIMVKNQNTNNENLFVSIALDEMSIRKHIQWSESRKKFMGFITHGIRDEHKNDLPVARNALVFMISGVNVDFHLPIAYYFIIALTSVEKADIISQVVSAVSSTGAKVVALTFDGLSSNFTACRHLCASFQMHDLKPYIINPFDQSHIYIMPDACHMIKLIRNFIASEKVFRNASNEKIEWSFFEKLENRRDTKNLVTHKLTKRHIQWDRAQMDVRLAVQTLSNSVAESFEYLLRHGCKDFANSSATAEFTRKMNDLFDILNTKRKGSERFFKNPITTVNKRIIFSFFDETIQYINGLTIGGKSVLKSRKRTGFKGVIICMLNLKSIFNDYVTSGHFGAIPTFNLSQDPLESLFSRVRFLNGNNDNPTVEQFASSIRKLLVQSEFTASERANCKDDLNILIVPSTSSVPNSVEPVLDDELLNKQMIYLSQVKRFCTDDNVLDQFTGATIAYNAGLIEQKVEQIGRFNCEECEKVFKVNDKLGNDCIKSVKMNTPCISTDLVCRIVEKYMKEYKSSILFFNHELISARIREDVKMEHLFDKSFDKCCPSHKEHFVKFIIDEYIRMMATGMAKRITLEQQKRFHRKKLVKFIQFKGQ